MNLFLKSAMLAALMFPKSAAAQSPLTFPTPMSASANAMGPSGDLYEAYASEQNGETVLSVVRVSTATRQLRWVTNLKLGDTPTPGGVAVDTLGNAYVSYNDMPDSETGIVKLNSAGVLISTATPTYQGATFSPLIADVDVDTATSKLYAIQTVVDPNSNDQTRALVLEYDWSLNLKAAKIISDASTISDEANGMRVDAGKDVRVGVTEYASGSEIPSYEIVTLNSALTQTLAIASASGMLDAALLVECAGGGGAAGYINQALAAPLTLNVRDINNDPLSGENVGFSFQSVPLGATGQSLSVTATTTDENGNASTLATLGNSTGTYVVTAGGEYFLCANLTNYHATWTLTASIMQVAQFETISISTGDQQIGIVQSTVAVPLTVIVRDPSGTPVANAGVAFSISSVPANSAGISATGQSVLPTSTTTASSGLAATILKLGNFPADYYVTCTCPSCAPAASSTTFHACGKLNVPDFSQGNPLWGNQIYGITVSSTIHALGCGLTSLADVNNFYTAISTAIPTTNPGALNTYLISLGTAGYQGGTAVNWPGIQRCTGNHIHYVQAGSGDINVNNTQASLLATADNDLLQGRPVIFHVTHPTYHFVVAIGKCGNNYLISDPGNQSHYEFDPNDPTFTFVGIRRFIAQ